MNIRIHHKRLHRAPRWLALLVPLLLWTISAARAAEATPAEVYAQAVRIEAEVESLKRHFKVSGDAHTESKSGDLKPQHTWAKSYILLLDLGKLRRKLGLAYVEPVTIEPMLEMSPTQPWSMTQRILTEIAIIKRYLNIPGQPPATVPVSGKRPIDAYNKLHHISGELGLLAGAVTSSDVYSQVKRIDEDVNAILRYQRIFEKAIPPPRRDNLQPKDSLRAAFGVMAEIQRIQRANGLQTTDFKGFEMGDKATPDDVYGMVALALVELQRLKAQFGMIHLVTAPGIYAENKIPTDVVQLLGYITDKLHQMKSK
jgi:hypothetical protein